MFAKLDPFKDTGDSDGRLIACGQFVIAGCHSAETFQAIDQPLDHVAFAIHLSIIIVHAAFVLAPGNHNADLPLRQPRSEVVAAVASIANQSIEPQSLLGGLAERDRLRTLVTLPGGHGQDNRFARAFDQNMQLGTPTAATAA